MIDAEPRLIHRHLSFGWTLAACFLMLGLALEMLHGFKIQWYLAMANETRRLLWSLAHAHGVLLGLLNVVYALSLRSFPVRGSRLELVSGLVIAGSICLPSGFLLGGIVVHGGDPNLFIVLSPIGGALLAIAMPMVAYSFIQRK
ncbi:hypothetical protein AYO46_02045 [Betaproteobacteria bacterium SCGC AG-212-J23]|nr:hypothetical protein AYO46_02045 [Betaproteobacteria bacterium SCGC AG-212-J23]